MISKKTARWIVENQKFNAIDAEHIYAADANIIEYVSNTLHGFDPFFRIQNDQVTFYNDDRRPILISPAPDHVINIHNAKNPKYLKYMYQVLVERYG